MAISETQVNAVLRHAVTAGGSVITVFTILGLVSPEQAQAIVAGMQDVTNGLQQAIGGIYKIGAIAGPVIVAVATAYAGKSGSVGSLLQILFAKAASGNTEAQAGIVKAASEVITSPTAASALPIETKVAMAQATVAMAADSVSTNRALLEGIVNLENVKGVVVDKQTAAGTPNPLVTSNPADIPRAA